MLKEENPYVKGLLKAAIVILFYLTTYSFPDVFLNVIGINIYTLNNTMKTICLILYESAILAIIIYVYKDFTVDITKNKFRLSLRDPEDKVKYYPDDKMWDHAENALRSVLDFSTKLPIKNAKIKR